MENNHTTQENQLGKVLETPGGRVEPYSAEGRFDHLIPEKQKISDLRGDITHEELSALKQQHGKGYTIVVGDHIAYFRNPTRQDINIAASELDDDNRMDYFEIIMRETFLAGSKEIMTRDDLYFGAIQQVKKKVDGPKAKLVNW